MSVSFIASFMAIVFVAQLGFYAFLWIGVASPDVKTLYQGFWPKGLRGYAYLASCALAEAVTAFGLWYLFGEDHGNALVALYVVYFFTVTGIAGLYNRMISRMLVAA